MLVMIILYFYVFVKLCLHEGKVQIHDFSIIRCDRMSRVGGGVCIYLKKYINFTTCVNYSNSVCELLILKLQSPSLIIFLMYKPPSCAIHEFDDIIDKVNQFIFSLSSPLPNISKLNYYWFIVCFPIGLDFPFITLPFQGCNEEYWSSVF